MSRGPGRWQRLLLHELYHGDAQEIYVGDYTNTQAEKSAAYRAARALKAKGWIKTHRWCNDLGRCDPPPAVADRERCELCKCSQVVEIPHLTTLTIRGLWRNGQPYRRASDGKMVNVSRFVKYRT
jgi:hypothetical protein